MDHATAPRDLTRRFPGEPDCVSHEYTTTRWTQTVSVRNTCPPSQKVNFQVLIALDDSPCLPIKLEEEGWRTKRWRWSRFLAWDGIRFGCA